MNNDDNNMPETYPLDETMISLMEDLDRQFQALQNARSGALMLYLRQHKLPGAWQIAENRREIVKIPEPVHTPG